MIVQARFWLGVQMLFFRHLHLFDMFHSLLCTKVGSKSILCVYSDGRPDHRFTDLCIRLTLALFLNLDLDFPNSTQSFMEKSRRKVVYYKPRFPKCWSDAYEDVRTKLQLSERIANGLQFMSRCKQISSVSGRFVDEHSPITAQRRTVWYI